MDDFSMRTIERPLTPSTSENTPQPPRRASHFVRESVMNAIVYNQGRRRGYQEAEVALRREFEDLDLKFAADLEQEREEQRRTVDKMKMDHRTEATITSLDAKRHVDEARFVMLKYQAAFKYECEQSGRKMRVLSLMHEQERQQMKEAHDYKVNHLYTKISKLVAEKTNDQDTVRWEYESAMEQKQTYIEALEKKLQDAEERLRGQGSFCMENERPSAQSNDLLSEVKTDRQQRAPNIIDQTSLVQQLQRANSEQANMILGLQASLSNLGRQITGVRGGARAHAYPGQLGPVYAMSRPWYQKAPAKTIMPPPMAYPQQTLQQANTSNLQHTFPSYQEASANTFTPQPITYPQQTLQQTNGSNPQHMFPQAIPHTSQGTKPAYHHGMWNPTPPPSHEQSSQTSESEEAKGNHISQGSIANSNGQ
ncbi:MAG: hypothetical protein Q9226_002391 [Calogaya cf. arnoldii]